MRFLKGSDLYQSLVSIFNGSFTSHRISQYILTSLLIIVVACRIPLAYNSIDPGSGESFDIDDGENFVERTSPPMVIDPTATIIETKTSEPLPVLPVMESVAFEYGGTSAFREGEITPNKDRSFFINASEGQTLLVGVSSTDLKVIVQIEWIEGKTKLVSFSEKQVDFQGELPATGTYEIRLRALASQSDFFLSIEIPAETRFDIGQSSKKIEGYIEVHEDLYPRLITRVRYLLYAKKDQTMTIEVDSNNNEILALGIYGQSDLQPYKRYEVKGLSGSFPIPTTQGYYIDVFSLGKSTPFTLMVDIK